ncbi:MAG: hypothetical protein LAO51_14875 [Acidobacteriia bacterium]|nr:hypothetical protein [Terriglobia bacterium]
MDENSPDLLRPTLTAGILFGAVASVPFLNLLNCACCSLVLGCGFFASWLYAGECRRSLIEFRPGTGAMVGLVSGAFYAVTESLLETMIHLFAGDPTARAMLSLIRSLPSLPAENRDMLEQALRQASEAIPTVGSFVIGFFVMVLVAAVFSTLGGLIGGAVFRVPPSASAPPIAEDGYGPPPSAPAV